MDFMLQYGFPAILVVLGAILLLVAKKSDRNGIAVGGIVSALAGAVWFIIGTF